jgi:ribose transport system substrate-binding protein
MLRITRIATWRIAPGPPFPRQLAEDFYSEVRMSTSDQASRPSYPSSTAKTHILALVIGGVVAAGIALFIAAWITGYFTPRPRIAVVTWNKDPYWNLVIAGAQAAAKSDNVDLVVIQSDPDEKSQSQHVRDLLDQGIQGIAISPNNPQAQADLLKEVAQKAILVTLDSDAPIAGRKAFVGSDNYAAGQLCAEEVRNAIPEGGEVILSVGSVDMDNARNRRQGLIDDLMDRRPQADRKPDPNDQPIKGAHYTIDATVVDGGDPAKATAGVADAIKSHPDAKCIVGLFSYSAPAIIKALDETNIDGVGMKGKIKVIGFDESDDTQAGVASGAIYSSILQDQYRCGHAAIDAINDALRGSDINAPAGAHIIALRLQVMHADDINDFRKEKWIHTPG